MNNIVKSCGILVLLAGCGGGGTGNPLALASVIPPAISPAPGTAPTNTATPAVPTASPLPTIVPTPTGSATTTTVAVTPTPVTVNPVTPTGTTTTTTRVPVPTSTPTANTGTAEAVEYLALQNTTAFYSKLSSAGITTDRSDGTRGINPQTGTYQHPTGEAALGDKQSIRLTRIIPGSYDFATTYTQSGATADSTGVAGVATFVTDMPATGGATYAGGAVAAVVTGDSGYDLTNGASTLVVDFALGTADLTLNKFTTTSQITGAAAVAPIDQINVTGLAISGNTFSGNTVTTTRAGTQVNLTGAHTNSRASGGFFGQDNAQLHPDEAGGVLMSSGDDGAVFGAFLAN